MSSDRTGLGVGSWVLRGILALAALAAPIITFWAFTDTDIPNAIQQQGLSEARAGHREPANRSQASTYAP